MVRKIGENEHIDSHIQSTQIEIDVHEHFQAAERRKYSKRNPSKWTCFTQ